MPGTHSPISRHLFTLDGSVLTTGGAKNLAKGQFTIVNSAKAGANGAVVITDFAGQSDSTVYEMRLGKVKLPALRTSIDSKPYSSQLFRAKDVVSVKANFPKATVQKFDDLVIGYDGINATTAIDLDERMTTVLDVTLSGDHIMYKTGMDKYVVKIHFGREVGETNEAVIKRAAKELLGYTLSGGISITEFVDIKVVDSESVNPEGTSYTFSTLTVTDEGGSNALARIQRQYPTYTVKLTARNGLMSTYTILHPTASTLANYALVTSSEYIKNCADCAAGYTDIAGGYVYSVTIEDDGADLTTTIDNVPGFVTGSVIRQGNRDGRGLYTVVTTAELTDAQIAAYVGIAGPQATATFELLGEVSEVCYNTTTTTTAWVNGNACYASVQDYNIQLRDSDCGTSRLAELQAAYPTLTIVEGAASGNASRAVTLTGTSGTANINVGGTNYLTTFATSLTQTATNFVTANAAAILAAYGVTVTANAGVLTFVGSAQNFPAITITNATTNLAGTVAAVTYPVTTSTGGCQRVYSTQVTTNVVCEECDPMFTADFITTAPADFDFTSWELVIPTGNANSLMGIRITGRPFNMYPTDISRDQIPFYETSTRISVSGGYIEETSFSFDPHYSDVFSIKRLSRAQDRDQLGAYLMQWEDVSRAYFDGQRRHWDNQFARAVLGEESVLKFTAQYVGYQITVEDHKNSQGLGRHSDGSITYIIWAELGYHLPLQDYINSLAARAGVEAVQPTAMAFS